MKFGVLMFPADYAIDPVTLGRAAEDRGFESLFFPEHTHIPTNRESPYPGGGELPLEYSHTLDPFVAFGAIAATTERIKLATGIALIVERDPITLAKEVATLDQLSNGRVMLGVGGGWNREEMRNHGTEPATRWRLMRERIEAMQALWTQEQAEYHGELVDFDPVWSWPKPVQQPHPPILVGGNGANTLKRVVSYGDEWMPIAGRGDTLGRIPELQERAAEAGRDPIPVSVFGAPANAEALDELAEAGVHRAILSLPPADEGQVITVLDRYASFVEEYDR
jgi:probable F420-dependent oxidoreductase